MPDLSSLEDLLEEDKYEGQDENFHPSLRLSSQDVEKSFSKKMDVIKRKELEVEAQRSAAQIGFPHIDLQKFPVTSEALKQIPREVAEKLGVVCFFSVPDEVRLGAINPNQPEVQQLLAEIEDRNHAHGALYIISQPSFDRIMELYRTLPVIKPLTKDIEIKLEELERIKAKMDDFGSLGNLLAKSTTTDTVVVLLAAALKFDASDIHVEAEDKGIVVRFRLDGLLHDIAKLPKEIYKRLLSRIKLVSSLKLNITEKPQDGRFTIKLPEYDVDVRVSTIPTVFGESVVLRLLEQKVQEISLESLGIRGTAFEILKREIKRPNGMIVTTGPTGSGKTTTLYAILKILNEADVKIITLEDPVEYRMEGINQSQIDRETDYTFAKALRSVLRQDPDIVMVGEIRDAETADIAVQAALTGHLMLSTLHTNNVAGAIPRFISMGVKPFLLAPALNCVMAQRLVRRVCTKCRKEMPFEKLDEATRKRVEDIIDKMPQKHAPKGKKDSLIFYVPGGCEECNGIGYRGRIGIYEVFPITHDVEQMILDGKVSEYNMAEKLAEDGIVTMVEDGLLKALDGLTTLSEIFRVSE